jgi:hypothetical protein
MVRDCAQAERRSAGIPITPMQAAAALFNAVRRVIEDLGMLFLMVTVLSSHGSRYSACFQAVTNYRGTG